MFYGYDINVYKRKERLERLGRQIIGVCEFIQANVNTHANVLRGNVI